MTGRSLISTALALLVVAPGAARAELGPPEVVSSTTGAQANGGSGAPAVSADGRYVVFSSQASNLYGANGANQGWAGGGVFRKDLDTGTLDVVVPAVVEDRAGSPGVPSVSGDGRYVVFDSRLPLVEADTNTASDVYRRDMRAPIGDPAAFTLVSAGTDADAPLVYASSSGAQVAGHAISADGNIVVFAIGSSSNALQPDRTATTTGAGAIVARDIGARTTQVINLTASGSVPTFSSSRAGVGTAPSVTADGKVALWYADGAEAYHSNVRDLGFQTLVQRPIGGSASETRVVAGPSDPEDPACVGPSAPSPNVTPRPCDGVTYTSSSGVATIAGYAANGDGSVVAVAAATRANGIFTTEPQPDVMVVDMRRPGARKLATRQLTAGATATTAAGANAIALTGDGSNLAFTATSWSPNLNPPTPAGAFPAGPAVTQPYLIDLRASTIRLVGTSYDGSVLDGGVSSVALSEGSTTLAMQTAATNLFFGDANAADDIAVRRELRIATPTPLSEAAPPAARAPDPEPLGRLAVTAKGTPAGGATVTVAAPWAGRATVDVRRRATVARKGKRVKTQPRVLTDAAVTLTEASRRATTLAPRRAYLSQLRRARGIDAVVTVTLRAPGRAPLVRTAQITLRRTASKAPTKTPASKKVAQP